MSGQDTREQLERCLRVFMGFPIDEEPDPTTSGIYYSVIGLLDRQAAITDREHEDREDEIAGAWDLAMTAVEEERDRLKARVAELEAENERQLDVVHKQAESFKGIEVELAAANSACDTLRASVAELKTMVECLKAQAARPPKTSVFDEPEPEPLRAIWTEGEGNG